MGFLRKKADPISDRAKELNARIASLEAEIKKLDSKLQQGTVAAPPATRGAPNASKPMPSWSREPVFEPVDRTPLRPVHEPEPAPEHFNDLGVRKYDLAGAWRRLRGHFRAPPVGNPKLVTYLAAGSIKGLRPLRYEKRIARNRFIVLLAALILLIWGIIAVLVRSR